MSATHATNPGALPATPKGSTWAQLLMPAEQERLLLSFFILLFVRLRAEAAAGGFLCNVDVGVGVYVDERETRLSRMLWMGLDGRMAFPPTT